MLEDFKWTPLIKFIMCRKKEKFYIDGTLPKILFHTNFGRKLNGINPWLEKVRTTLALGYVTTD